MLCGYIHVFVFTCKLLCSVWAFCLIAFWPVTKVLSCPLRRAKNRKERLVSLSVGKVQLGTSCIVFSVKPSCLELSSAPDLACLMHHQCLCNVLNNFMLDLIDVSAPH